MIGVDRRVINVGPDRERERVGEGSVVLYGLRCCSWSTGNARSARPDFHIVTHPGRAQANFGFRIVLDLAMKIPSAKKNDPK